MAIGVFLLDDHEVVRRGIRDILTAEPDIEVVGEADRVATALPLILELRPDVAGGQVHIDETSAGRTETASRSAATSARPGRKPRA